MCNFSHLQIGESVTLCTENMNCSSCGQASGGVTAKATYLGHSENTQAVMDRFSLSSLHKCPHCGKKFTIYQEFCTEWYFLSSEIAEREPLPRPMTKGITP